MAGAPGAGGSLVIFNSSGEMGWNPSLAAAGGRRTAAPDNTGAVTNSQESREGPADPHGKVGPGSSGEMAWNRSLAAAGGRRPAAPDNTEAITNRQKRREDTANLHGKFGPIQTGSAMLPSMGSGIVHQVTLFGVCAAPGRRWKAGREKGGLRGCGGNVTVGHVFAVSCQPLSGAEVQRGHKSVELDGAGG